MPRLTVRTLLAGAVLAAAATTSAAGATAAAGAPVPSAIVHAAAATPSDAVSGAAQYATSRGYHIGVAVYDTATGHFYGGGDYTGTFASESVVKAFIATRLLVSGQMHGSVESMAWKMITQSDDAMASALYGRVGGDGLITWVKHHYRLWGLGSPPRLSGWWGNTHITAKGMTHFYAHVKADPVVGPWLMHAMHNAREYGSDGTYQFFGLPSATSHAAVKQGWGCDYDDFCTAHADFNSTGFVNGDRYTVALLARGPLSTYGSAISALLTGVARTLLPGGTFPAERPTVTGLHRHYGVPAGGSTLLVFGTGFAHVTKVMFGAAEAPHWHALSQHRLEVTVPKHDGGMVNIHVTTPNGTSSSSAGDQFRYVPAPRVEHVAPNEGSPAGGATITVTGANFRDVHSVTFGDVSATFHATSTRSLTVTTPRHPAGRAHLVVTTAFGVAAKTDSSYYRFVAAPVVHRLTPDAGAAGTSVTLTGANFRSVTAVTFGSAPASSVQVVSPTEIVAVAPAHVAGTAEVEVTTRYGAAQQAFTYS